MSSLPFGHRLDLLAPAQNSWTVSDDLDWLTYIANADCGARSDADTAP